MLDSRTRAQLRACIELWRQGVRNSRVHPAEIHACEGIFRNANELPMDIAELDELFEVLKAPDSVMTVSQAAIRYGILTSTILRELSRRCISPCYRGRAYHTSDLLRAVGEIRRRDGRA